MVALLLSSACGPAQWEGAEAEGDEPELSLSAEYEQWAVPIPCEHHAVDPWEQTEGLVPAEDEPCVLPVPIELRCADPVPIFEAGAFVGDVCPEEADRSGLTIVDLSGDWAPRVLGGDEELGPVPYREIYAQLSREEFDDGPRGDRARQDRFLELYGVFPAPEVVLDRLDDGERHACHAAIDHVGLPQVDERGIDTWRAVTEQRGEVATVSALGDRLQQEAESLGLASPEELADHPKHGPYYARYAKLKARVDAIAELQEHLRCEGLLDPERRGVRDGVMGEWTIEAMQLYHRRHMIVSWQLDRQTADVLTSDTRELDFATLLRTLRERVVDATGLIADGTALNEHEEVAGRIIDTEVFLTPVSDERLPDGQRDRVAEATDAAARALGWTSPDDALAAYDAWGLPPRVALRLPPKPWYHRDHMEMHVEIDRGDVWYDFPYTPNGDRAYQPRERKPHVVVYADTDIGSLPLARWPTTIGSWKPERLGDGSIKMLYKESPAGPRIIRDVVAAPRWIPPYTTPDRDLMRPRGKGVYVPRYTTMGPHYASAYGLVMMIHHRDDGLRAGERMLTDQGIRTHGSVSYETILDGFSHGCHRIHNHRAVRLSGFLLAHRDHVTRGPIPLGVSRRIRFRNQAHRLIFDTRGFRYELTPPVDVQVHRGRIFGRDARPGLPRPLTRPLLERYGLIRRD